MKVYYDNMPEDQNLEFVRVHDENQNLIDYLPLVESTTREEVIQFLNPYKGLNYTITQANHPETEASIEKGLLPVLSLYDEGEVLNRVYFDVNEEFYSVYGNSDYKILAEGFETSYDAQRFLADLYN